MVVRKEVWGFDGVGELLARARLLDVLLVGDNDELLLRCVLGVEVNQFPLVTQAMHVTSHHTT